jgi:hypothetical protein
MHLYTIADVPQYVYWYCPLEQEKQSDRGCAELSGMAKKKSQSEMDLLYE